MTVPENTSKNTHNTVARLLFEDGAERVLDIPCGPGAFTQRLIEAGIEVHSADIENVLKVNAHNFMRADMNRALPYDNDYFDGIACIDGIEHLEQPFAFIRECHRILRASGALLISTPNINALRSRWRWMWTGHHNKCKVPLNENAPSPLHHINMMSFQRLRYILHTSGFRILTATCNRVKGVSLFYTPLVPVTYIATRFVYEKLEKDPLQKRVNREILRQIFRYPILFGETLIVKAVKK